MTIPRKIYIKVNKLYVLVWVIISENGVYSENFAFFRETVVSGNGACMQRNVVLPLKIIQYLAVSW